MKFSNAIFIIFFFIPVVGSIVLKDYWEAATIVFLFTIAEWLESRASHKVSDQSRANLNIFLSLLSVCAFVTKKMNFMGHICCRIFIGQFFSFFLFRLFTNNGTAYHHCHVYFVHSNYGFKCSVLG